MIYQLYFDKSQESRLFPQYPYRGFGLEPTVNPAITSNCPELDLPEYRSTLVSYGGILHLSRNAYDDDDWIGFTSYRQLDKSPVVFQPADVDPVRRALDTNHFVGWLYLPFDRPLATQAEDIHPGILRYLGGVLNRSGFALPPQFFTHRGGFFAEYWAMKKETLRSFMEWLYPYLVDGLARLFDDPYLAQWNYRKSLGFVLERLFVVWCYLFRVRAYSWPHRATFQYPDGIPDSL